MKLVSFLLFGVAVLLLVIAGFLVQNTRAWVATSVTAEGTVVEVFREISRDSDGRRSETYYPTVEFATPDGIVHRFDSSVGHGRSNAYRVGDAAPVRYQPDSPRDAEVDSTFGLYLAPIVLGFIGTIAGIIGVVMFFLVRTVDRQTSPSATAFEETEEIDDRPSPPSMFGNATSLPA